MVFCANCGKGLPEDAVFCPDCGARALDYTIVPTNVSPSHFNSGMTATTAPPPPSEPQGFAPPPPPEERRRPSTRGRVIVLVVIAFLLVVLVAALLESGLSGVGGGGPTVNSPGSPFTGEQLYSAYAANQTQAEASYNNKTVYVQDNLDSGAEVDPSTGDYFSSVDSGAVVLYWSSQVQVGQLQAGSTVLAKCSVAGVQLSVQSAYILSLRNCDLISVQSQTSSVSISIANA